VTSDGHSERVLSVAGEIDLHRAPEIRDMALGMLDAPGCSTLALDLSEVTFIDSTTIGALVDIRNHADSSGRHLVLQRPSQRVRRILEITGLLDSFTIES
jgi:anti-sigma B factor antagonist